MAQNAKTILLVDDSPSELALMNATLKGKGYKLVAASNGEEALEKLTKIKPDLILLDVILPKKNGFQVIRQIRTSPDTRHLKVVLVSGKSLDTDRYWGLKQGADDYLTKPFTGEQLIAAVSRHL
jgi:CheY-like chemotaxis protein